jgi:hypothetical protein
MTKQFAPVCDDYNDDDDAIDRFCGLVVRVLGYRSRGYDVMTSIALGTSST